MHQHASGSVSVFNHRGPGGFQHLQPIRAWRSSLRVSSSFNHQICLLGPTLSIYALRLWTFFSVWCFRTRGLSVWSPAPRIWGQNISDGSERHIDPEWALARIQSKTDPVLQLWSLSRCSCVKTRFSFQLSDPGPARTEPKNLQWSRSAANRSTDVQMRQKWSQTSQRFLRFCSEQAELLLRSSSYSSGPK